MNLSTVDLNLLVLFEALAEELNATRAAARLSLTQPAVSHGLKRLREMLGDALFVRNARGLTPTRRAQQLKPQIAMLLEGARGILTERGAFDPAKITLTVRISTTDYYEQIALPGILGALEKKAPGLTIVSRPTLGELPKAEFEAGTIDIAIAGFFGALPEGYYQQKLYEDDFVCVVRRKNPFIRGKLNVEQYLKMRHLMISPQGDLKGRVDALLAKKKQKRLITAGVASFTSTGWILCESDLLLTCPRRLAERFAEYLPVDIHEAPFDVGTISVIQVWHERTHSDPALAWLRALIKDKSPAR